MLDVLLEIVIRVICYPVGWAFIKVVILGRRPDRTVWCADTPENESITELGAAMCGCTRVDAVQAVQAVHIRLSKPAFWPLVALHDRQLSTHSCRSAALEFARKQNY